MWLIVNCAAASTSPHFGGILRVKISERVATVDPRQWPSNSIQAAASERLASLVFDRLVRFDDHGSVQSVLAISWSTMGVRSAGKFRLRGDVKFADGSPLTAKRLLLRFSNCSK